MSAKAEKDRLRLLMLAKKSKPKKKAKRGAASTNSKDVSVAAPSTPVTTTQTVEKEVAPPPSKKQALEPLSEPMVAVSVAAPFVNVGGELSRFASKLTGAVGHSDAGEHVGDDDDEDNDNLVEPEALEIESVADDGEMKAIMRNRLLELARKKVGSSDNNIDDDVDDADSDVDIFANLGEEWRN